MQNFMLSDHSLKLSLSKKNISEAETLKKKEKVLKKRKAPTELSLTENEDAKSNKLIVKNLAFEATDKDLRELFKQYGSLKKVRMPKKVGGNHRYILSIH
jgi:multiple RNA-binding domain-containing protein 1